MDWILILVILICPLMHLWMMKKGGCGHKDHKDHKDRRDKKEVKKK